MKKTTKKPKTTKKTSSTATPKGKGKAVKKSVLKSLKGGRRDNAPTVANSRVR